MYDCTDCAWISLILQDKSTSIPPHWKCLYPINLLDYVWKHHNMFQLLCFEKRGSNWFFLHFLSNVLMHHCIDIPCTSIMLQAVWIKASQFLICGPVILIFKRGKYSDYSHPNMVLCRAESCLNNSIISMALLLSEDIQTLYQCAYNIVKSITKTAKEIQGNRK